jgi:hypothetical protein
MIAGRPRDDACAPAGIVELQQPVQRTANLETTADLQGFGLEPDAAAAEQVDLRRADDRRAEDPAFESPGGR